MIWIKDRYRTNLYSLTFIGAAKTDETPLSAVASRSNGEARAIKGGLMSGGEAFLLDDPWSVDASDFPETGSATDRLAFLLNYAALAPSVLGTEPWTFHVTGDTVLIRADLSRKLPVTDPMGRELVISCGAALLNLRVAARSFGHELAIITSSDAGRPDSIAEVRLISGAPSAADRRLRDAIAKRRTHRGAFHDRLLPRDLPRSLTRAARQEGATLSILDDETGQQRVSDLVLEARRAQLASPAFRSELSRWVELRIAEAHDHNSEARLRLGLDISGPAGHTPEPVSRPELETPSAAGTARMFGARTNPETKQRDRPAGSSILALLTTRADSGADWLVAGQSLQRVLLVAATKGTCATYLNAPIEVDRLRSQIATVFNAKGEPQVLLRIGFGTERRPTPRRSMKEIVA